MDLIANKDSIFHYTTYEKAIKILLEKRLKFSNLKNMNDPREKDWRINSYIGDPAVADHGEKLFKVMKYLTEKINLHYKAACFCRNKYSRSIYYQSVSTTMLGYARLRMWSQYADKHAGVCIVFSIPEMRKALRLQLGKQKLIFGKDVSYKRDFFNDYEITGINNDALINPDKHINKHRDKIFFTKYIDYKDENEYRFVIHDPKQEFDGVDIAQCVKAIILWDQSGDRYSKFQNLCNCNKLNNVKFYEASWETGNGPNIKRVIIDNSGIPSFGGQAKNGLSIGI